MSDINSLINDEFLGGILLVGLTSEYDPMVITTKFPVNQSNPSCCWMISMSQRNYTNIVRCDPITIIKLSKTVLFVSDVGCMDPSRRIAETQSRIEI